MLYHQGFDVSTLTLGTLTIATAGKTDVVITLNAVTGTDNTAAAASTSLFWMYPTSQDYFTIVGEDPDQTAQLDTWARVGYPDALQAAIRAEAATQGWAGDENDFTVTISASTGALTFTYDATFTMVWSVSAGRDFLGFSANQTAATSHTSDQTPQHIIIPTLSATSLDTTNYEPGGIANHAATGSGAGTGVSRTTPVYYRDWIQQYETKAKTLRGSAASTHPATFQQLIEESRGQYPFIVVSGFNYSSDEAFWFRSEGTSFRPERATVANDNQFHIEFLAIVAGEVSHQADA